MSPQKWAYRSDAIISWISIYFDTLSVAFAFAIRQYVFFTLNRYFLPSTSSTIVCARADATIVERRVTATAVVTGHKLRDRDTRYCKYRKVIWPCNAYRNKLAGKKAKDLLASTPDKLQ